MDGDLIVDDERESKDQHEYNRLFHRLINTIEGDNEPVECKTQHEVFSLLLGHITPSGLLTDRTFQLTCLIL